MKYISLFTFITMVITCCNEPVKKITEPVVKKDSMPATTPVKKFGQVVFASPKDLSCGMPLTAGLEDTTHYKGKVYGFCSAECKADFIANAKVYVK